MSTPPPWCFMSVLASLALLIVGSATSPAPSQPPERVRWTVTRVTRAARGDTHFVQIAAQIDPGWHVYSLTQQPEGPFPLRVTASPSSPSSPTSSTSATESTTPWTIAAGVRGPSPERQPTSPFGIPVEWYSGAPQFTVPVLPTAAGQARTGEPLRLRVRYQACSETLCLPPRTIELSTRLAAR